MTQRKIEKDLLPFEVVEVLDGLGAKTSIARRARGWTQADVANKAGVGLNTMGEIEKGSPSVQFGHWLKVLWALDQLDALEMAACPEDDALTQALLVRRLPKRVRDSVRKG
jgi:transcriptional regulator with XRE-family HTH domain